MSISSRIEAIEQHLTDDYSVLTLAGADLTNVDKNIQNLKQTWEERLLYFLANGTDTLWNNWEKVSGSGTEISLNNTIEAKMKVDLKGNTKQSILPSGYTQVEYIESTGTQYIDTGFSPNQDTRILVDALFYDTNTTVRTLFSSVESNWGRSMFTLYSYGYKIQIAYGNSFSAESVSKVQTRAIYDMNKNILYINGEEKYSLPSSTFTNTKSILLLARKTNNVLDAYATAKIYSCKIYDNNVLVRNMIPCYRNSDNEIGLYDLVGNQFYTNSGTGTFTKGNNTPTPDTPIDIQVVSGDNTIKVEGKNLFDPSNFVSKLNQTIDQTTGIIISSGGSSLGWSYDNCFYKTTLKAGTYTATQYFITKSDINYGLFRIYREDNTLIKSTSNYNIDIATITFTLNEETNIGIITKTGVCSYYLQLEKNNQATSYEPCQSQNYPVNLGDIELCKIGTHQDKIAKSSGKNLNNIEQLKLITNSSGEVITNNGCWNSIINVENANSIYISGNYNLLGDNALRIGLYNQYPVVGTSGVRATFASNNSLNTTNYKYVLLSYMTGANHTISEIKNSFMVNYGDTLLPYEPYGTSWYLNKQIGKVVLDGSEGTWGLGGNNRGFTLTGANEKFTDRNTNVYDGFCNYFNVNKNSTTWGSTNYCGWNTINTFWIREDEQIASTVADFKIWLSTHNVLVYYVLATPTYEEITDDTLISQLEAIKSLNEQTNISQENNDLPFELDVVALKKLD